MQPQPRSVLVVEDDDEIREMMTLLLEMDGHVVTGVATGHAALTYLQGNAQLPDLMVLDLELGNMTGDDLITVLCQREEWRAIPIVMVSASQRLAETAQACGVAAYLRKPFEPRVLQEVVRQHARSVPSSHGAIHGG